MTIDKMLKPIPEPVLDDPWADERRLRAPVSGGLEDVKRVPAGAPASRRREMV